MLLELLLQLHLPLGLLLGPANVQGLPKHLGAVELLHRLLRGLAVLEGHEAVALALAVAAIASLAHFLSTFFTILHQLIRRDLSELGEDLLELLLRQVLAEVL